MIVYRNMEFSDIDAGLSLCRAAKWNQLTQDWKLILNLSTNGCRVAESGNKVIGSVTTIRYPHFFGWIGMVLVDPDYRRQGVGTQLLKEALNILREEETVKLDATPEGREVYLKLNFVDEYPLSRMVATVDGLGLKGSGVRLFQKKDFASLIAFDREIFGADRHSLLKWMLDARPQYAYVLEINDRIQGYCLGRQGYHSTHIGPVVANNIEIAKNLIATTLLNCIGQPVILDALHFDTEWTAWLATLGFEEQRPFTRMYRGIHSFTGMPEKQYAILGPEFG
ncbi:MAG TPA: GNAT family N-acetyltransferase [Puia sp.]|jgi:GNAT superfamily N-acetyltransferase|nr:GNAT family N-acetyltransferase [Puia sp.]